MSTRTAASRPAILLAALSALALSMLWVMSPVLAEHDPADGPEVLPIAVGPNNEEWGSNSGGNVPCPEGTTELKFDSTPDGTQDDDVELPDGSTANVEITVDGNSFWFIVDGGLAAYVIVKGTNASNVYDYTGAQAGFAGPGIAHDDGLLALSEDSISHIAFCLIELEESESEEQSVPESEEESVPESEEQSVPESEEQSVPESEAESGEQSVAALTFSAEESTADSSLFGAGSSPLPTIAFSLILLASLGALAYANVKMVRSRI
ncbi:MAG: hypothetical protein WEB29_11215 [Chloroflexota bacterium]